MFGATAFLLLNGEAAKAQSSFSGDWSGFYLGGDLGHHRASSAVKTKVDSSGNYFTGTDPQQIAERGDGSLAQDKTTPAFRMGYLWQRNSFVFGVDASVSGRVIDTQRSATAFYLTFPTAAFNIKQTVTANWSVNLRPRLGYAYGNWLPYLATGLSVTRLGMSTQFTDTAFNANSSSSISQMKWGYSLGGGVEYALGKNWSLRGEYLYTDYGRVRDSSAVYETQSGASPRPILSHSADLTVHSLQLGLSYRF